MSSSADPWSLEACHVPAFFGRVHGCESDRSCPPAQRGTHSRKSQWGGEANRAAGAPVSSDEVRRLPHRLSVRKEDDELQAKPANRRQESPRAGGKGEARAQGGEEAGGDPRAQHARARPAAARRRRLGAWVSKGPSGAGPSLFR